jgi:hypothetical protein
LLNFKSKYPIDEATGSLRLPDQAATNGIRSLFDRKTSLFGATIFPAR